MPCLQAWGLLLGAPYRQAFQRLEVLAALAGTPCCLALGRHPSQAQARPRPPAEPLPGLSLDAAGRAHWALLTLCFCLLSFGKELCRATPERPTSEYGHRAAPLLPGLCLSP